MNWTPEGSSNLRNVCCCGLPFQAEADTNCGGFVDCFDIQTLSISKRYRHPTVYRHPGQLGERTIFDCRANKHGYGLSQDYRLVVVEKHAIAQMQLHRSGQRYGLGIPSYGDQHLRSKAMINLLNRLFDNRTFIKI